MNLKIKWKSRALIAQKEFCEGGREHKQHKNLVFISKLPGRI